MQILHGIEPQSANVQQYAKFLNNIFEIFDHIPIPINFVDEQGRVVRVNQAMLDYFGLRRDEIDGQPLIDIEPTTRLPIVLKNRKAEIAYRHRFHNGKEAIVHRIPVIEDDQVIGGIGIILIGDLKDIYYMAEKNKLLMNKIADYEKEGKHYTVKYTLEDIIGNSPVIRASKDQIKRTARSNSNVLILGESGVGKELFAHAVHNESSRRDGPFIRVNCAAIPEMLLEAELFGYDEGAFTGAKKGGQPGKFELANGGTIFLDEIGDMPYTMQAKLLRVLQEKEFERVGGKRVIGIDVRVVAATNAKLESLTEGGQFRRDLYYRLNVLSIKVPPLRERLEDIPGLIYHFLRQIYQENGLQCTIPQECMEVFARYDWPGNIRELRNVVEKIAVEAEGRSAAVTDIPQYIRHSVGLKKIRNNHGSSLVELLEKVEAEEIARALETCGGNKIKAAEYLQIPKVRLYRKLKKYGMDWQAGPIVMDNKKE